MITPVASDVVDSEIICGEVLLRVEITMLNPGQDRSMLVIYRVVLLRWGGAWNLQAWRTILLEWVNLLIYGEFRSLLDVGTLTPNPGVVSYMLLWKTIMLGVETLLIYGEFRSLLEVGTITPNPVQARFMLV